MRNGKLDVLHFEFRRNEVRGRPSSVSIVCKKIPRLSPPLQPRTPKSTRDDVMDIGDQSLLTVFVFSAAAAAAENRNNAAIVI